jgi:protoporphyrinogen/coproporphyrinogen III oxidase
MKRIAIVGGGISGLAAAFELEQRRRGGVDLEYTLYESSSRPGGVLRTDEIEGCILEAGPDSFLTEKPWASDLCRLIGLGDQLIGSNDAGRKTYILTRGRLVEMPDGLMLMVPTKLLPAATSRLFSWKTKLRVIKEFFDPPLKIDHDESVRDFVERHYGREMFDRLADPLLSGIYGAASTGLSVRAVLPRLVEMERAQGSLGRALLRARRKVPPSSGKPAASLFTSLKSGMGQMAERVVSYLRRESLLTDAPVAAIVREAGGWQVTAAAGAGHFDAVILALPAPAAGRVLGTASPELAAELDAIEYTSSVTVGLGYNGEVRRSLPPGFGFLVPRSEDKRLLAATFVHNKFPHRAPENRALLRCFLAGKSAEDLWGFPDDQLIGTVCGELQSILGLRSEPRFARVYRWKSAMPHYAVGHLERVERIEKICRELPAIALCGNAFRGVGLPDCVRSGRDAARRIVA